MPSNASNSPHPIALVGKGVGGLIDVTGALTFGVTAVGDTNSLTRTVKLTNPNTVPLTVDSVTPSGDFAIVAITPGGCIGTLAAKSSCTVGVTFTPAQPGTRTGSLTVDTNASNSPKNVTLKGTGELSAPTFSPKTLAFGKQTVGVPKMLSLTVNNPNTVPLGFTSATIPASGVFTVTGDTCSGNSIGAGAFCTIGVTFTPTAKGASLLRGRFRRSA